MKRRVNICFPRRNGPRKLKNHDFPPEMAAGAPAYWGGVEGSLATRPGPSLCGRSKSPGAFAIDFKHKPCQKPSPSPGGLLKVVSRGDVCSSPVQLHSHLAAGSAPYRVTDVPRARWRPEIVTARSPDQDFTDSELFGLNVL